MQRGVGGLLHAAGSFEVADDVGVRSHSALMPYASRFGKCLSHQSIIYERWMSTPDQRLKQARENAGYASASDAARALDMSVTTYVMHENGRRGIPKAKAPVYARKFKVTVEWLLFGSGKGPAPSPIPSEDQLAAMLEEAQREVPASATFGDWPRIVASNLRSQLALFLETGLSSGAHHSPPENATDKGARSRGSTRPAARE